MSITWIEASAGTGKTYTLVKTVVDLITGGLPAEKVLLVTFTDKATAELKTRIREGLRSAARQTGDPRLVQALEDLPALTITTIHGFCRGLLTQFPLESGVSFEPEMVDQGSRWRQLLRDRLRPRLTDLDPVLLAWAGLEDEEELLAAASAALSSPVFDRPLVHPDSGEQTLFARLTADLKAGRGLLADAAAGLKALNLPDTADQAFGEAAGACLHASWHRNPYARAVGWGRLADVRRWPDLLGRDALDYLAKWDEGTSIWKKGASAGMNDRLAAFAEAARTARQAAAHFESALPEGLALGAFLTRCARWAVLSELCLPVREERSDRELTFHDLIDRVRRLVTAEGPSPLREGASARWEAVLIDEFQDTDPDQWAIFEALFARGDHRLTLVGDPKQSIYRFRGADLDTYRRVGRELEARGARRLVLKDNYRSTAAMIAGINRLFAPGAWAAWDNPEDFTPSDKGDKPIASLVRCGADGTRTEVAPLDFFQGESDKDWRRFAAGRVLELLSGGYELETPAAGEPDRRPVNPGDILILVRKKAEAWQFERLLTAKGVPCTVGGSGGLLRGREAQEVLLFLKALENPGSLSAVRALAWTRLFAGCSEAVLAPALDAARNDRDRGAYLRAFRRVAAAREPGVTDGGGLEHLLALPGGPRLVTNTEHVLELVQERWHRGLIEGGRAALALETMLESGLQEDEVDLRRAGESPTVKLLTIHAAKGLEAPLVIHGWPGAGKPPQGPRWYLGEGADFLLTAEGAAEEARREAAEDLRVRYVAFTRARAYQAALVPGAEGARPVPETSPAHWRSLPGWRAPRPSEEALDPPGAPVEGLDGRHPRVESHSGLWRRALAPEEESAAEWDRPRSRREADPSPDEPVYLAGELPAGTAFGDLVHDILEQADWRSLDAALVADHAQRHRAALGGRDHGRQVREWLTKVLAVPVPLGPGTAVVFARLAPEDTRRELEFHLPLGLDGPTEVPWGGKTLTVRPGYLTGRIDVLFRLEGRLYLADWKTNRLAPGQNLDEVMADDGYDLQAQWYWEALRRLCRLQREGLEPGGVVYVFLRGPDDRPRSVFLSPEHLNAQPALDRLFREGRNA